MNKAIKRATVKALSSHGLGISLYAGEELPSVTDDDKRAELREKMNKLIDSTDDKEATKAWVLKTFKISDLAEMTNDYMTSVINTIERKQNESA